MGWLTTVLSFIVMVWVWRRGPTFSVKSLPVPVASVTTDTPILVP